MREFIIADNQDITKAGMMFLLGRQKDTSLLLEADNKAELIQQLRLHPTAVVILDYTLFDFSGAEELMVLHERFKEADWLLFSDELSLPFLRQVLFSSMAFGVVLKDNSKEEILTALQCASRKERFICNHVSNLLLAGNGSSSPHPSCHQRRFTDYCRTEHPERDSPGENNQRNSRRKKPQLPYGKQPQKEYLPETGCKQCARGYQICHEGRHRGLGGILYINLPTPDTQPGGGIIHHSELARSNALQLLFRYYAVASRLLLQPAFDELRRMAYLESHLHPSSASFQGLSVMKWKSCI